MVLNYIWVFFFIVAFIIALYKLIFMGDVEIFGKIMSSTFEMSKTGFEISLGLTGVLTLWMGIMKIGEMGGAVAVMSRMIYPLFRRLFPDLPKDSAANGAIMMNLAANMLGLDNAATPMGLKAMQEMQKVNTKRDTATNSQIMFLVLNTSGLTLVPVSIMVYRAQMGANDATDVFIPILLATYCSTIVGLLAVAVKQGIKLYDRVVLAYLGGLTAIIASIILYFSTLDKEEVAVVSNIMSNVILFGIIICFIVLALIRKVNVYEAFIEGAKDGFSTAIKIIPYLIAILVAIGVFRTSGAMDVIIDGVSSFVVYLGFDAEWVKALPTALMKPLSGGGARGLMVDTMKTFGVDSFAGRLASTFQGATDTTFYIIAVYFGSVGIRNTRYAVSYGLIADAAGIIAAIAIAYLFWG